MTSRRRSSRDKTCSKKGPDEWSFGNRSCFSDAYGLCEKYLGLFALYSNYLHLRNYHSSRIACPRYPTVSFVLCMFGRGCISNPLLRAYVPARQLLQTFTQELSVSCIGSKPCCIQLNTSL